MSEAHENSNVGGGGRQRCCPRCSYPLTMLDKFCGSCGCQTSRSCPRCEHLVAFELRFCNYCGNALPPVEITDRLSPAQQAELIQRQERETLREKAHELEAELRKVRKAAMLRRFAELIVVIAALMFLVNMGLPLIEERWNRMYQTSPVRILAVFAMTMVFFFLLVAYRFEVGRHKEQEMISGMIARLALAKRRMEELEDSTPIAPIAPREESARG